MMTQFLEKDKNPKDEVEKNFSLFWRKPATFDKISMEVSLNEKVVNFPTE
jgi:hypothetical protein